MTQPPIKKQNTFNIFLNDYFNIVLAGVLIFFLGISYFIFLMPKFRSTQEAIQANTEEKQLLFENTQKRLANLQAISEIYNKINPVDLQKFNSVLPDNYIRERLYGELEEIIGSGGWILSSVTISPPESNIQAPVVAGKEIPSPSSGKNVGAIELKLSINAVDYAGFKRLLRVLESNLRLFDITEIQFSPSGNSAAITLTTYYYQAP